MTPYGKTIIVCKIVRPGKKGRGGGLGIFWGGRFLSETLLRGGVGNWRELKAGLFCDFHLIINKKEEKKGKLLLLLTEGKE